MSQPFYGEIRMFAGNFAPAGWFFCDGSLLPISEHETLFNLIGTTYGGDGQTTFALPDLRSRLPVHAGTGPSGNTYTLAQNGGVETVTLTTQHLPAHSHAFLTSNDPGVGINPAGAVFAQPAQIQPYIDDVPSANMAANALSPVGGSQPHENRMPYLCVSFIISDNGIFPSQT